MGERAGSRLEVVRSQVLGAARGMHERGLVEGTAGNVSGRVDAQLVVVTPAGLDYQQMTVDDLVVVDAAGDVVEGHRAPTSELALHLECYRAYPEVGGVVHCHATYSSMFAVAHRPIPAAVDEFVMYVGGEVACADHRPSGTDELAERVVPHLADRSAVLMANHGLVCIGRSASDALHTALVVEHDAKIVWGAAQLGRVVPVPERAAIDFHNVYVFTRRNDWAQIEPR